MKTNIQCGVIIPGEVDTTKYDAIAKKLEQVFTSYIEEAKPLPEAAEECEISVTFAAPEQVAAMNAKYREVEGPTDVLSFPMWEDENGKFTPADDWLSLPLGDIIVCPEVVAKNAQEHGKSEEAETVLVICHGFLHLIGYDHADDAARDAMWRIQDSLTAKYFDAEPKAE